MYNLKGIHAKALQWLSSFLRNRTQTVQLGAFSSRPKTLSCGVLQGASLSPTLFNAYVSSLAKIGMKWGFSMCSYADDTQLTISIGDRHEDTRAKLNNCLTEMATWMSNHCLKLNAEKSEILLLGGANHIWEASWWPHSLGVAPAPKQCAKNLGILIDNTLSMRDHVRTLCGKSFATLKLLKRLFPWIPLESRRTVTQALLLSRLDYGNALLVGMPDYLFKCLQVVQNAEAKLVCNKDRYSSATECLRQLHWLPMRQRARFKLLGHTHRALHHTGPRILQNKI